jgi:ABC-type polysaccharide/polyol phosphate transport system ATPase subunit
MNHVVETVALGKRYRLGQGAWRYSTLGETLAKRLKLHRHLRGEAIGEGPPDTLWALQDLDLTVEEGEAVGIIGRNGAGKSTLLRILTGITEPTVGVARTRGRIGALLEVGTGFHPELTGRENIYLNAALLGMSRRDTARRFEQIVDFAGVDLFLNTPLKRYSSGMALRLAFAVAAHLEPDILIVDEVLAVGDAEFQHKCLGRIAGLQEEDRTLIFVSHDLGAVARLCSRAVWLDHGRIHDEGDPVSTIERYLRFGLGAGAGATVSGGRIREMAVGLVEDGKAIDMPLRTDHFQVRVDFVLAEPVPALDVELSLLNGSGARVLCELLSDTAPDAADLSRGGHVLMSVPPILTPGDYTVAVWLGSQYEDVFDGEVFHFTVVPLAEDPDPAPRRERLVQPRVEWTVDGL